MKEVFEHQTTKIEPNTLTKLLQRNKNVETDELKKINKIDYNRKTEKEEDDDEKENIFIIDKNTNNNNHHHRYFTDNNHKILNSSQKMSSKEEDQKILCKNIHLWPPITTKHNLNNKKSEMMASNDGCTYVHDIVDERKNVEKIINKRHFHIIDKNYDENVNKYENNINFHDWHGVSASLEGKSEEGMCLYTYFLCFFKSL